MQNKLHWAITGETAAEIVHRRANAAKPNMGLTSWRGQKVRKGDVMIAKNYLAEDELRALNNLVEQYLLFAEGQAMRRITMHMADWIAKLNDFLTLNGRAILDHTLGASRTKWPRNWPRVNTMPSTVGALRSPTAAIAISTPWSNSCRKL